MQVFTSILITLILVTLACGSEPEPDKVVGVVAECRDHLQQLITGEDCIDAIFTPQITPGIPIPVPTESNDTTVIQQADGSTWTVGGTETPGLNFSSSNTGGPQFSIGDQGLQFSSGNTQISIGGMLGVSSPLNIPKELRENAMYNSRYWKITIKTSDGETYETDVEWKYLPQVGQDWP
ncbi:MAG TPA: hypothetical protein DGN60_04685 [Chloroflexi bacterium]|nr:hypothetical protein [Chloroflexota bacterium]|tara:strand:+ start:803 stop:1339 length:537 start_codon:yes stop_codon:yes gene_type:complete